MSDAAVSLRLLRLLHDVASTVENDSLHQQLIERGERIVEGCHDRLTAEDLARPRQRLNELVRVRGNPDPPEARDRVAV